MATIDKISAILNTKIELPFKIKARESIHTGNPFRNSNFDGNILPADIFEGTQLKSQNKAKMIMSAVAGSITNFAKKITEPISAFCTKVKNNVSSAWSYCKTTTLSDIGNSISEKISSIRENAAISKISENTPVLELEALWNNELELMKGAA